MQSFAQGPAARAATHAAVVVDQMPVGIDVSAYANSALMLGEVHVTTEAFGVTVTRRADAGVANLTGYERARLLDVMSHARRKQLECGNDEQAFPIWLISSDARDVQPRNIWLTIRRTPLGHYLIDLSDV
jgi:hypothetical protein